ncbi:MAG: LacI family DNA-binding transcriptional regulator, partial [Methyloligellaceae bacterium]
METAPTLSDVARKAGVSTATVSRCLNTPDKVIVNTRERVLQVINELGYTPNFGGRALVLQKTHTVGAVIPTMDNSIFATGLQAFQQELSKAGITLLVGCSNYNSSDELEQIKALVGRGA